VPDTQPGSHPHRRRRRIILWSAGIAGAFFATLLAAAIAWLPGNNTVRRHIAATLSDHFDADVELKDLDLSLFPHLRVKGGGLRLTPRGQHSSEPLLTVGHFTAEAAWTDVFIRPRRIRRLEVSGLRIAIAPKPGGGGPRTHESEGCRGDRKASQVSPEIAQSPVFISTFVAPGTELLLLPRDPAKLPRRFSIRELVAHDVMLDKPMSFDAVLTNPTPSGLITTHGQFGPWVKDDPGLAAVKGTYVFEHASLGTIKGIEGTLASKGTFDGVLQQILVNGTSTTPDFGLDTSSRRLPLEASFDVCVDGTDGDTYLDRVDAKLASTPIHAKGRIEGNVGVDGRTVALSAQVKDGAIEDLLRLAVNSDPPLMTGQVSLTTSFLLPPGDKDVVERLQLDGQFGLESTRFTARSVQHKVDEFSRRGRGALDQPPKANVASDFRGKFALKNGTLRLSSLRFAIPGARVNLHGSYGLVSERIAFEGAARLDAKPSEMTTGFKSLLLKMIDPLFSRKDAGTVVPIHISGTRKDPKFGVDVKGALTRKVK
jgi:hypothetical protein